MENLTKQQIVLVTLLVSFVTSIATGIVTVALMQQVPTGVTQTINRVIERTVEKVVQGPAQPAAVVTRETVVVKADDAVVAAISQNTPSIVRLVPTVSDGQPQVIELGIILTKEGIIAADSWRLYPGVEYSAEYADGKTRPLALVFTDPDKGILLLRPKLPAGSTEVFTPVTLSDSDGLKLGQTMILIGGTDNNTIETGLISSIKREMPKAPESTTTVERLSPVIGLSTNIRVPQGVGGVLIDLSANVAAFELVRDTTTFLPSNYLAAALQAYTAELKPASTNP